jgi:hypothetical protein
MLVERYSGNPLALKLVPETIRELFDGDIAAFLREDSLIFDDIRDVLDQQWARLAPLEQDMLLWLAIEREAISFHSLGDNLVPARSRREVLEALNSLQRRSLLEKRATGFTLQNVVMEYATDRLVGQVCCELETGDLDCFIRYPLVIDRATERARQSQTRLLLRPLADRLVARLGRLELEARLGRLLEAQPARAPLAPGYAVANILHLARHLGYDIHGYNFS